MDLKNLFSRAKDDTGEPKKIKDYLGLIIAISLVCIFILLYFFLFNPTFKKQKTLIDEKHYMLEEIDILDNEISSLTYEVGALELERKEKLNLFVSEKEVEELYQLISFSAIRNNLKVKKLIRGEEEAIREDSSEDFEDVEDEEDEEGETSGEQADYYKIFVEYDIEGRFPDYLKLKQEIATIDKFIVFEKEEVKTTKSGTILASVKISLVRMPTR